MTSRRRHRMLLCALLATASAIAIACGKPKTSDVAPSPTPSGTVTPTPSAPTPAPTTVTSAVAPTACWPLRPGATAPDVVRVDGAATLSTGDEIVVQQVQGDGVDGFDEVTVTAASSSAGSLLLTVTPAPSRAYASEPGVSLAQACRVALFGDLTIAAPGRLMATAWNGTSGGVVAIRVLGTLRLTGGSLDASAAGFRGGIGGIPTTSTTQSCFATSGTNGAGGVGEGPNPAALRTWGSCNADIVNNADDFHGPGGGGNPGGGGGGGGHGGVGGQGQLFGGFGPGNGGFALPTPTPFGPQPLGGLGRGGGGGGGSAVSGGAGGAGGGFVHVRAARLVGGGSIVAAGAAGGDATDAGGGGGGAGGTVWVDADVTSGAFTFSVHGGNGGAAGHLTNNEGGGGGGGGGLLRLRGIGPFEQTTDDSGGAGGIGSPGSPDAGANGAVGGTQ